MFYITGIGTYVWILTNRKEPRPKGKIQPLDARDLWSPGGREDSKRGRAGPTPLSRERERGGGEGLEPDPDLRDFENNPLAADIDAYFEREVRPHVPDAWTDRGKDKVGCEIDLNRPFYQYTPPHPPEEIDADLKRAEEAIRRLLGEATQ